MNQFLAVTIKVDGLMPFLLTSRVFDSIETNWTNDSLFNCLELVLEGREKTLDWLADKRWWDIADPETCAAIVICPDSLLNRNTFMVQHHLTAVVKAK